MRSGSADNAGGRWTRHLHLHDSRVTTHHRAAGALGGSVTAAESPAKAEAEEQIETYGRPVSEVIDMMSKAGYRWIAARLRTMYGIDPRVVPASRDGGAV